MKYLILFFLAAQLTAAYELKPRTWTSVSGNKIEGRLIHASYQAATIQAMGDVDGEQRSRSIPLERFIESDRNYIKKAMRINELKLKYKKDWAALKKFKASGLISDLAKLPDGTQAHAISCYKPGASRPRPSGMSRYGGFTGGTPSAPSAPTFTYLNTEVVVTGLSWEEYLPDDEVSFVVIEAGTVPRYINASGTYVEIPMRKYVVADENQWIQAQIEDELESK